MIRVLHKVACPIVVVVVAVAFCCFMSEVWQGGVFKVMKNDYFLVFLTVWVFFLSFSTGEGVAYIRIP